MIETLLLFVVSKIGLPAAVGAAVVYLILQLLKKGIWTTIPTLVKEINATVIDGWATIVKATVAAYEDGEISQDEAVEIYMAGMNLVTRLGVIIIELVFVAVPVKSLAWLIGWLAGRRKTAS